MPKLNKAQQEAAESASSGFSVLDEGRYIAQLTAVTTGEGPAGPYWSWEYSVTSPDAAKGRKLWNTTSLSEKAAFKVRETFDALGYTLDSDTDEMIGESAVLIVSQVTIEKGKRKGQLGNQVDQVLPLGEDDEAEVAGAADDEF